MSVPGWLKFILVESCFGLVRSGCDGLHGRYVFEGLLLVFSDSFGVDRSTLMWFCNLCSYVALDLCILNGLMIRNSGCVCVLVARLDCDGVDIVCMMFCFAGFDWKLAFCV